VGLGYKSLTKFYSGAGSMIVQSTSLLAIWAYNTSRFRSHQEIPIDSYGEEFESRNASALLMTGAAARRLSTYPERETDESTVLRRKRT
jgi:hypothetical protein